MCTRNDNLRNQYKGEKVNKEAQRETDNESLGKTISFLNECASYITMLGNYMMSLITIGRDLEKVVLNGDAFDESKCYEIANGMQSAIEKLQDYYDKADGDRNDLEESIRTLTSEIKDLENKIKNLPKNCGSCTDCIRLQQEAESRATTSATSNVSSIACFLAGTLVHTNKGLINIEKIKENDMVLSYDVNKKENVYNPVLKLFIHEDNSEDIYEFKINDKLLKATENHPFYIAKDDTFEWIEAKYLKIGDGVMLANNEIYKIDDINKYSHKGTVYNLEVENTHNYFVFEDGVLVHNKTIKQMVK